MLKYINYDIVFREVPNEVSLAINISNCKYHCMGCHSNYLWDDIGEALDIMVLEKLINKYRDTITCVCFMGGELPDIEQLCALVKLKELKTCWYTGRTSLPSNLSIELFDYIKLGPYIEKLGGLNKNTTNQRMYHFNKEYTSLIKLGESFFVCGKDITYKFWK